MSLQDPSLNVDTFAAASSKAADSISPTAVADVGTSGAGSASATATNKAAANLDPENLRIESGRRLKSIVSGMSSPFCCGGTITLKETPTVQLTKNGSKVKVTVEPPKTELRSYGNAMYKEALAAQPVKLKDLIEHAPPPFLAREVRLFMMSRFAVPSNSRLMTVT
jgi:hypothetical protein